MNNMVDLTGFAFFKVVPFWFYFAKPVDLFYLIHKGVCGAPSPHAVQTPSCTPPWYVCANRTDAFRLLGRTSVLLRRRRLHLPFAPQSSTFVSLMNQRTIFANSPKPHLRPRHPLKYHQQGVPLKRKTLNPRSLL